MFRKTSFIPDNYYHIYNRGTDKREIFLDNSDYLRFVVLLHLCNNAKPIHVQRLIQGRSLNELSETANAQKENTLVDIGAYCLMPNHFHLLLREKGEIGTSFFIRKLCTAYAMYFNKKNKRSGNLFQGRFKAELVNKDGYLNYLFAYIHLNPIKLIEPNWKENGIKDEKGIIEFLDNYQWSSYIFYTGKKRENSILDIKEFPNYFENFKEFKVFIKEWLNYQAK